MTKYFIPKGTSCSRYQEYSHQPDQFITTEDVLYDEMEVEIYPDVMYVDLPMKAHPYKHLSCYLDRVQKIE